MNFIKQLFTSSTAAPQMHIINGSEYHELNLIAEGGYGYIWRVIEAKTRQICILKKTLCQSEESLQQARDELEIHRKLNHPNIVQYLNGTIMYDQKEKCHLALIVMEICEGGTLFDLLLRYNEKRLNEGQVLLVMKGIKYLHSQQPPVQHRDIKVENILLHNKLFKLCDFGSASTQIVDLSTASKMETSKQEEQFSKFTTEMYRPPEMTDTYQKYKVSEKVDIWMLGCILYTMCFYIHPFQDSSKLSIVEASFKIPSQSRFSEKMHDLIRIMLTPNPEERPSIFQIEKILINYHKLDQIELNHTVKGIKQREEEFQNVGNKDTDEFDDFQSVDVGPQKNQGLI